MFPANPSARFPRPVTPAARGLKRPMLYDYTTVTANSVTQEADTGLAEEQRDQLLSIYRFTKAIYQSVPVDFTYEAAGMKLGSLEIVHLPGHCPGHGMVMLWASTVSRTVHAKPCCVLPRTSMA